MRKGSPLALPTQAEIGQRVADGPRVRKEELPRSGKLLRSVFRQPVPMTILVDPDVKTYTPEEVCKVILNTYLMALLDVQDYIEGETLSLEELLSTAGKAVVADTSQRVFVFSVPKQDIVS